MSDEPQIIKNAENYNLADDSKPQIIATGADKPDTREQLEADIEKLCTGILAHRVEYQKEYCKLHGLQPDKNHSCWSETQWLYPVMLHLLDRQAAITEREVKERVNFSLIAQTANALFPDYQERIDELTAERDALKAKLESYGKVPDQDECKKQQPMESGDTREQLEADVQRMVKEHSLYWLRTYIIEWLDRQAAITTAYCTSEGESCCEACRAAQKRKIAELTVGCDELREALKAFELGQMYSLYKQACMDRDEWRSKYEALRYNKEKVWCDCDCCNWRDERERLTDEVESLKRANRIQAESFQAIEYELAQAKAAKHD